jgi:hypothetical protein
MRSSRSTSSTTPLLEKARADLARLLSTVDTDDLRKHDSARTEVRTLSWLRLLNCLTSKEGV